MAEETEKTNTLVAETSDYTQAASIPIDLLWSESEKLRYGSPTRGPPVFIIPPVATFIMYIL
jgi:hypothetical protein